MSGPWLQLEPRLAVGSKAVIAHVYEGQLGSRLGRALHSESPGRCHRHSPACTARERYWCMLQFTPPMLCSTIILRASNGPI